MTVPTSPPTATAINTSQQLRDERLNRLVDECQSQIISQLIGPFGLNKAMFEDKTGGNVTAQHNADQGIFAKESEELSRADYDYSAAKSEIKETLVKSGEMSSRTFKDQYTGKIESTTVLDTDGKVRMNAEFDHVKPIKEMHRKGLWMADKPKRSAASSDKKNLKATTRNTNRRKGGRNAKEYLNKINGFDPNVVNPIIEEAEAAIQEYMPTTGERVLYHGKELVATGAVQFGKMGMKAALGVLLVELVNGLFNEIKAMVKAGAEFGEKLVTEIRERLDRIFANLIKKFPDAFGQFFESGVSGVMSNLLTFIINNVVTTAKRFVTVIREGLLGLFKAFKMIFFPPQGMTADGAMQAGLKILTAAVVTSLGLLIEESIKSFLLSLGIPFADIITPVLIGLVSGILSALLAYAVDAFFEKWRHGKELDEAMFNQLLTNSEGLKAASDELVGLYESAVGNLEKYAASIRIYQGVGVTYAAASTDSSLTLSSQERLIQQLESRVSMSKRVAASLAQSREEMDTFMVRKGNKK